jgi:hypothetical protein
MTKKGVQHKQTTKGKADQKDGIAKPSDVPLSEGWSRICFALASIFGVVATVLAVTHHWFYLVCSLFTVMFFVLLAEFLRWKGSARWYWFAGMLCAGLILCGFLYKLILQDQPRTDEAKINTPDVPKTGPAAASQPETNEERMLLDVKPEYLLGFFGKYNNAQAQKILEPYIGKWVQISGEVISVDPETPIFPSDAPRIKVMIRTRTSTRFTVFARFQGKRWVNRVEVLRPQGESITVFGQIADIAAFGLSLVKCEVVE